MLQFRVKKRAHGIVIGHKKVKPATFVEKIQIFVSGM